MYVIRLARADHAPLYLGYEEGVLPVLREDSAEAWCAGDLKLARKRAKELRKTEAPASLRHAAPLELMMFMFITDKITDCVEGYLIERPAECHIEVVRQETDVMVERYRYDPA
jgi:hypothetical protein